MLKNSFMTAAIVSSVAVTSTAQAADSRHDFAIDLLNAANNQVAQAETGAEQGSLIASFDESIMQLVSVSASSPIKANERFADLLAPANTGTRNTFGSVVTQTNGQSFQIDPSTMSTKTNPTVVVPLPPAAFAGLGLLAGIAGVRFLKSKSS